MKIYGLHTCQEAIQENRYRIKKIYLVKNKNYPDVITRQSNIVYLDKKQFEELFEYQVVHQGIAMEVELYNTNTISDLQNTGDNYIIAMLDNVTDPHNLGAVIRSAAVFGIKGIIIHDKSASKPTNNECLIFFILMLE